MRILSASLWNSGWTYLNLAIKIRSSRRHLQTYGSGNNKLPKRKPLLCNLCFSWRAQAGFHNIVFRGNRSKLKILYFTRIVVKFILESRGHDYSVSFMQRSEYKKLSRLSSTVRFTPSYPYPSPPPFPFV